MPVGLEVFDENGVKILGMDKSVLRITHILDYREFLHFRQNHNAPYLSFISCFIDLDAYPNERLITHGDGLFLQFYQYAEKILIGEHNVPNNR